MPVQPLRIVHPTDFSATSHRAFFHALKLAIATRGDLFLLHIKPERFDTSDWSDFPQVRQTLEAWGFLEPGARPEDVQARTGIQVAKFDLVDEDIGHGMEKFTETYGGDLVVLGTEGRNGFARWVSGSRAERIMRTTKISTLFIPAHGEGFVDADSGTLNLNKVLTPVDHAPNPLRAIRELIRLIGPLGLAQNSVKLVHVGDNPPVIKANQQSDPAPVECLNGSVVSSILDAAGDASLIAMVTAGNHGLLDALRGSTTEQIIRQAACPVLAIPAR